MQIDHGDDAVARSDSPTFEEVAESRLSRRAVLGGSVAAAAATFLGTGRAGADERSHHRDAARRDAERRHAQARSRAGLCGAELDFRAIPLGTGNEVVVPAGYVATAILPWGTPILPGAGAGSYPANAAQQERRMGLGHDGMWFFPSNRDASQGVLCINQEFGTNDHIEAGTGVAAGSAAFVALSQAAHGVAVVELRKTASGWAVVRGRNNRRITPNTDVAFSGPAAGSAQLENPARNPLAGTVNNCANGKTPWGTYLTCEENFNGYFGANGSFSPTAEQARYGFSSGGFGYGWHVHDPRFDLTNSDYANEHKRFGWVVEIDPFRPWQKPVKRTALGRFKHENCEIVEGRGGQVVAYMGDDERFDYVYKFVSSDNWRRLVARGMSPLDHGTLYVARFADDGSGEWLPLTMDNPALAARFSGMDDLLINTRIAGDIVGATPMDRPEWAAANPLTGEVFITMTNNTRRGTGSNPGPDGPNPRGPNPWGHIVRIDDGDHIGTNFAWDLFVLAGPAGQDGSTTDPNGEHGSPDGIAFDDHGRLWIQTDGSQPGGTNDQMLVADPGTGAIKRFLTGVTDCEVTGWTTLGSDILVNLQHPGNGDPAVTSWPAPDSTGMVPRDACVVISEGN